MKNKSKSDGFSLIEVLIVLFIIGLMSSAVILFMPQSSSDLDLQAKKLSHGFNALIHDSLVSGRATSFGFSDNGYAFYTFINNQWEETTSTEWPEGLNFEMYQSGKKLDIPENTIPIFLFKPNGLITPFRLKISDSDYLYSFSSHMNNGVEVVKLTK